jgi:hypothetical protein
MISTEWGGSRALSVSVPRKQAVHAEELPDPAKMLSRLLILRGQFGLADQRLVSIRLFFTNDEMEQRRPHGVSLRSHDLPVPGKERHRQCPLPSPFS